MREVINIIKEWWTPLIIAVSVLFFIFRIYFQFETFEPQLRAVAVQAEENSRKIEVGFTKMEMEIERNRNDIIYFIKHKEG